MHFHWTTRRVRNRRVTESLISCGFIGRVSLFYADNVRALFSDSHEAVEPLRRFSFVRNRDFQKALLRTLPAANSRALDPGPPGVALVFPVTALAAVDVRKIFDEFDALDIFRVLVT